jgi:uncharacterized protein
LDKTVAESLGFDGNIFFGPGSNRASMAVTFESVIGQKCFTISANHLKSKGPSGSTGDNVDQGDGQGAWNARRNVAAEAVIEWLKTDPTKVNCTRQMILGDLNAYAREDPVQTLENAGYKNVEGDDSYSYVFDGLIGTLDYILVNEGMEKEVNKAAIWHINEDEADALDYLLISGRPETYFDGNVPFRSSDHSPVLVGLKFGKAAPKKTPKVAKKKKANQ